MPKPRKFTAPMHKSIVFEKTEVVEIEGHGQGVPFMEKVRRLALKGLALEREQAKGKGRQL